LSGDEKDEARPTATDDRTYVRAREQPTPSDTLGELPGG
jgi:hypothetical protein